MAPSALREAIIDQGVACDADLEAMPALPA
jgi:hypothetical protein